MAEWTRRSAVPAAMFNPAFLALVVGSAADGYEQEDGFGLPYPLAFLVAPLVLHHGTRDALPSRVSTHFPVWVGRQPLIQAAFPARARSLAGPVREGIRFGLRHGLLRLQGDRIVRVDGASGRLYGEAGAVLLKAAFVGRWMSRLDRVSTAFTLLGVRP